MAVILLIVLVVYLTKSGSSGALSTHTIHISEVMTSNKGTVPDNTGDFPDWVEIENTSSHAVDIGGYGLSDDLLTAAKWTFPAGTKVPANGFIIVYCSGDTERGPMHTPFKLSADEDLILSTEAGAVIDDVALHGVTSGYTLSLVNGAFVEMLPSPGYPNTEEGSQLFMQTLTATAGESIGVTINEFMASNASTLVGPDGTYCDWIELYNATGTDIDLSGYGISDSPAQPLKYTLPQGTRIPAYGTLLLYCTGRESSDPAKIEIPFGLAAYEEAVVFSTPAGKILDSVEYSRQQTDQSMARNVDGTGSWQMTTMPTPGHMNTASGAAAYRATLSYGQGELMISELMNGNKSYLLQPDGTYPDWIEIYNRSAQPVDLTGYALSNNAKNPAKWVFPSITLGAGQYLTVLATGNNQTDPLATLETNFGISGAGETVFLFSPDAKILDKYQVGEARADISVGRGLDGTQLYYTTATPGTANGTGMAGIAETPKVSVQAGMYTAPQSVELTIPLGSVVRYTLDGSVPTAASPAYTAPIAMNSGVTVLRAKAFQSGMLDSDILTATYFVNMGETEIENHRSTLPVVSLVSDPDNYFGAENGIYVAGKKYYEKSGGRDSTGSYTIEYDAISDFWKYANFNAQHTTNPDPLGREWERDTHIEYFDESGTLQFQEDVVSRIFGAYSRYDKQKGIALVSRPGYGSTAMNYKFFEDRDLTSFKSLTLRASAKDVMYSRIRDILIQSLLEDGGSILPTQAYKQVVLYINGEYWGVYNLREKVNKYFLAQTYNLADPENIDILVGNGDSPAACISGNAYMDYVALLDYVKTHDLSDPSAYAYVCSQVDVENFAEYCAMEIYVGNTDTGNIKFWRSKQLDNKWRWIPYDFDWAFNKEDPTRDITVTTGYRRDFFKKYFHPDGHGAGKGFSTVLSRGLLENSNFRALFLEKCALMMDIFETDKMIARIDEMAANIADEMVYDTQKWGVLRYKTWETRIEVLREAARNAPEYFLYYAQQYFSLSDSDMNEIFGRRSSLTGVS